MTGTSGRGGGHIPDGYIIWITVNIYVTQFTYLFTEIFKKTFCVCKKKIAPAFGFCKVLRLFQVWVL